MSAAPTRFGPSVVERDPERRRLLLTLLEAALQEVEPEAAVERALLRAGTSLQVGDATVDLDSVEGIRLIAFGKAAPAMVRAAHRSLAEWTPTGIALCDHSEEVPPSINLLQAGHPVPDERSAAGARRVLDLAREAGPDDLVVCLISGGGSALLEQPADGIEVADLSRVVGLLLASGAPITEVNTVRRHLSAVKGGRLAEAIAPARLITLVLSDVVGSPLDAIASGPTVPDPTTFDDAQEVLERYGLSEAVPVAISRHLRAGSRGEVADTPSRPYERQTVCIVGDGAAAAEGARRQAEHMGVAARVETTTLTGEARRAARWALRRARRRGITIYAGETTVTVVGEGRGGRNQEAALSAAMDLEGRAETVFAAFGTDGVDGPTPAAGAIADGETVRRGREAGLDPAVHLGRNDAHTFLSATGDLLRCGPTGTNVGDLWLVYGTA